MEENIKNNENLGSDELLEDNLDEEVNENVEENNEDIKSDEDNVEDDKDAKIEELTNSLSRLQADFINYKNRTERERSQSIALANERLILKLLPIIDDIERALDNADNKDGFYDGITLIHENLLNILEKEGLKQIDSDNKEFDPNYHHAILMESNDEVESNHIIETFQKGYILNDKVIRPSMVKVSE